MVIVISACFFVFFKQKTAYEMRISDWSSDVCSSDLVATGESPVGWVPARPLESMALAEVLAVIRADGEIPLLSPDGAAVPPAVDALLEIGRASCRARVSQ